MIAAEALADPPKALADALNPSRPACAETLAAADPPAATVAAKVPTIKDTTMFIPTYSNFVLLSI